MITVEPGVGSDDEYELVDEQSLHPAGACNTSWENWGNSKFPQSVFLDLGKEWTISAVHLFNHGGDGEFRVSSGTPGNWTVFVTNPLIGYTGWESHGVNVTTRYVRLTKTTSGKMAEIVLYGHPAATAQYALAVTVDWNMGNVYRNPSAAAYPAGTPVELTAVPLSGFVFDRWTEGATTHTANPLTVVMDRDRTLTAVFKPGTPAQYTLSTSVTGQGSLSPSGGSFNAGQTVNIHATAASGWKFDRWEGDASGGANPLALVMNANKTVKAVFTFQGTGTSTKLILTPAMMKEERTGGYAETPAANLVDEQNLAGDPRAGAGGAVKTHWMPSWNQSDYPWSCYLDLGKDYVVTDVYLYDTEWKAGTFNVSSGSPGNWTLLFSDMLDRNGQWFGKKLSATTRYLRFTRLSTTAFVNEVVVYGYPAGGSPTSWSLTVTAQGNGTVAKSPNMESYPDGTEITLTATPASGWRFLSWSGDAAGGTNPYTFTIRGNTAVTAVFEEIPGSADQIENPGFELGSGSTPFDWTADAWHMADAKFGWEAGAGRNGSRAASIENTASNDARWIQPLTLKPDTYYSVTGWVKGANLVNQTGQTAANLFELKSLTGSNAKSGTFDWTLLGLTFQTVADGSAEIWARLGHWGNTVTGKAWFDDFSLIELKRIEGEDMWLALEESDLAAITPANLDRWIGHLDAAYLAYHDLVGFYPHGREPLGVVSYRQDFGGWAAAYFPIRWLQTYVADELKRVNDKDDWSFGILHEMGHIFSHPSWDYGPELWANFHLYYVVEQLNGLVCNWERVYYRGSELANLFEQDYWKDKQAYWNTGICKHNPMAFRYVALTREIGWGPFKQAFRDLYANGNPNAAPIDKFNLFLDKLSQYAGRDVRALIPYDDLYEAEHNITGEPVVRFTLDVTITGSGGVDIDPDLPYYNEGAPVKLSAVPAAGFKFAGWSGGASGTQNPLSLTMNANKVITATFVPTGGGTSQKIALTAAMVKNEKTGGYGEWPATNLVDEQALAGDPRGGAGGAVKTFWMPSWNESDYPWSCYLDLGQSYVVTDVYLYDQEWKQGSFSVSSGAPGAWTVLFTDALTRNNQWFGQKLSATTRYLRLTRHATGSFVNEVVVYGYPAGGGGQWTLGLAATGSGSVSKSPDLASYPDGTQVVLTAAPASGWKFSMWQEYGQTQTANPWTITMDRNRSVTAVFEPTGGTIYQLAVTTSGSGTVSPSSGSFPAGQSVTITATAAAGWKFDRWEGAATGSANPLTLAMNGNKSLTAVFIPDGGGGGDPKKIPLSSASVQNESGLGNAGLLVNEQGSYPAAASTADANVWIPSWNPAAYPLSAVVDLGQNHVLTKICLWDLGDSGNFTVSAGAPGSWAVLFTDPLTGYSKWNEHAVNVTTRYIRVTKANAAKMGEIVFIGYPAGGGGGPVTPPPGQTGDLKLAAKTDTSITLDWSSYAAPAGVASYKVYRDEALVATTANKQYTDTGLSAGQHVNYVVEADGAGKLGNSLTVTPGHYYNKLSILAREALVTSSATEAGAYANKAFDGDIDSSMSSAGVNPAWVQVAFPAAQPIGKVRVYLGTLNSPGDVNSWRVEAADTEADLASKSGSYVQAVSTRSGVWSSWDEAAVNPALSRKIFRVTVERTQGGSTVNIREVEFFGLDVKTVKKTHNVVVIQYNPVIVTPNGSMPVETYFHDVLWGGGAWPLAADNLAKYIEGFRRATGGLLDLKVKNHHILDEFPPVMDGTPVTRATFLDAYMSNAIDDQADYAKILNDPRFNIVPRVESGEIDGVWIIQCNSAGFWETCMAGDGAYWVNGAVVSGVTCKRKFVIHGFDYRGEWSGMAHMTGHMSEQTLRRLSDRFPVRWRLPVWNTYDLNDPTRAVEDVGLTDVTRFFLSDSTNYSYLREGILDGYFASPGNSELGSIHFPPNANQNYGYQPDFQWLAVDGAWTAGGGKDMTLTTAGNGFKVVAAPQGIGFAAADGILKAKVNVQSGAAGAHAGLILRTSAYAAGPNAMKGYYVGLDPANDRVILARLNNGFTVVGSAPVALEPNRDYTLKIKAAGSRFDVYVSNMHVPVLTATDAAFAQGTLGYCAYNTTAKFSYFDFQSMARNYSEAWYSYPDIAGAAPITVGPETWKFRDVWEAHGGDFLFWWFEHLPKNTGIHAPTDLNGVPVRGRLNTWLPFIFDINNFDGSAVYDAAFPAEDTEAPAPVVNLKAAVASSHVVELTWEEPADNIGVTRYDILRGNTPIAQVKATRFTDTGLAPGTAYTYTVKARDGFGNRSSATVAATTQANTTYLSDLDWASAVNGFSTIGIDKANGGEKDIYLGGVRYAKGLGVHANSEITYAIGGGYKRFIAKVGASDGEWGFSARFEVWGDGAKRFDSGPMYGTSGPTTQIADIDIDLTGVNTLVLKLVSLDAGISGDHGDWAGARLVP